MIKRRKWFSEVRESARQMRVKAWRAETRKIRAQEFYPKDSGLMKKLGLRRGEKVLFFAGCYGDWAQELSRFCQVKYTDPSSSMLASAKQRGKTIDSFRLADAESVPQRANIYDWSFSFEPYPIALHQGVNTVIARSLLNRKGLLMVFSPSKMVKSSVWSFFRKRTQRIADL